MHRDIGAPVRRGLHRRTQLRLEVLHAVDRVVHRRDAATRGELHLRRAESQLLANRGRNLVGAVGDQPIAETLQRIDLARPAPRRREPLPEIAVTAGLADDRPRGEDPRSHQHALVDGLLEAERRTAHVTEGREAPHQDPARLDAAARGDVAGVVVAQRLERHRDGRMHVRIDQARDHHAVAGVDEARWGWCAGLRRRLRRARRGGSRVACIECAGRVAHLDDPAARDHDLRVLAQRRSAAVEDPRMRDDQVGFGPASGHARCGPGRNRDDARRSRLAGWTSKRTTRFTHEKPLPEAPAARGQCAASASADVQTTSNNPAAPMPPPMHIVTTTYFTPSRLPASSAWPTRRWPLMP